MRTQPNSRATPPRLTTLVTVGVSATVLLTVLALLILVDHFALNYVEREAGQRLQQLSWQMRDALNRGVQKAGGDVRLLSELPQLRAARSPDEVRAVLDSLQRASPDYAWIGLAAPDGRVLAATQNLLEGVDVSNRAWFQAGRDGLYAGDAGPLSAAAETDDKLPASGAPWRFIDVAGPVPGADGGVRGVLGVRMSWGWARRLMHGVLAPAEQTDAAEIFVVRGDGQVLLGPAGMEQQRLQTASLALSHSGKSGAVRETWSDEREYLSGYSLTGQTGDAATLPWSVIVRQPLAVALAEARALERQILLLGAVLGVVLAAAAAVIARRYTRPFNQLSAQLERHSDAPDDAGLPDSATIATIATVGSFHELQVLSGALARMVHKEQQHLAALRTLNEQLETTVAERGPGAGASLSRRLELTMHHRDGQELPVEASVAYVPRSGGHVFIAFLHDISERKHMIASLENMALHDTLTGLPNRRALMQALPAALLRAQRSGKRCAVFFLDLDRFKQINDRYGHEEGDELLRQFADRVRGAVRKTDPVGRLAGDEFIVIVEMLGSDADAYEAAEKLGPLLRQPFMLKTVTVALSASVGVAIHPRTMGRMSPRCWPGPTAPCTRSSSAISARPCPEPSGGIPVSADWGKIE